MSLTLSLPRTGTRSAGAKKRTANKRLAKATDRSNGKRSSPAANWSDWKQSIGPAIQVVRIARRMTQADLAESLGQLISTNVDQSYISKVEARDGSISLERLCAVCEVLEFPPDRLFRLADEIVRDSLRSAEELHGIGLRRLSRVPVVKEVQVRR